MRHLAEGRRLRLVLRTLPWPMRGVEVQAEEERSRIPPQDDLYSAIGVELGRITLALHGHFAFVQAVCNGPSEVGPSFVGEVGHSAAELAEELLVPALRRAVHGRPTKVPFADERRAIACSL